MEAGRGGLGDAGKLPSVPVCRAGPHFTEEIEVQRGQEALLVQGAWNRVGTKPQYLTSRS